MAVVATGFFDGVHIGHRLVIETLVSSARERGEESLIITLWPHPRLVLQNGALDLKLLNTLDEKLTLLKGLGVDRIEVLPFTKELSEMSTAAYLKNVLQGQFGATALLLGYDNRIGHDMLSPERTASLAESLGLDVIRTDKVSSVGIAVSSTKIRRALQVGDVELAAKFLCYDYGLRGEVVHGKKLGRTIGYPTANIEVEEPLKLVPAAGVYLSDVLVDGREFKGMTNIGQTIETHIFDFDEEIYGQTIGISFVRKVRDEKNFSSIAELKNQLEEDERNCKNLIFGL